MDLMQHYTDVCVYITSANNWQGVQINTCKLLFNFRNKVAVYFKLKFSRKMFISNLILLRFYT